MRNGGRDLVETQAIEHSAQRVAKSKRFSRIKQRLNNLFRACGAPNKWYQGYKEGREMKWQGRERLGGAVGQRSRVQNLVANAGLDRKSVFQKSILVHCDCHATTDNNRGFAGFPFFYRISTRQQPSKSYVNEAVLVLGCGGDAILAYMMESVGRETHNVQMRLMGASGVGRGSKAAAMNQRRGLCGPHEGRGDQEPACNGSWAHKR